MSDLELELEQTRLDIIECLRQVFDPEIPVNIYDMGLIYNIDVQGEDRKVHIDMTLTTPNCPAAQELPAQVQLAASQVPGVSTVAVDIVWDPPWDPTKMSEEAQFQLGFI
ncbi:MAG: DUF59 domain-containing protein [Acidobacteria bacterium]|nr:DUF59 domain-containing protein [Acidobacteriota bacterium]